MALDNPLASKAESVEANIYERAHFRITSGSVIPLPPVYAPARRRAEPVAPQL
jgi:hypothetical protein